jgi:putative tryptophan/tyrosine transport system substrate-binding protein
MRRRLLVWIGLALAVVGLVVLVVVGVFGSRPKRIYRIGFLGNYASATVFSEGFRQGLGELGYVEGENIVVEWRYADVSEKRLVELADELVRLELEVLVGSGTQACLALKTATGTIRIVMGNSSDPVGAGLVASLGRPGGNVTGVSAIGPQLAQKRLALLRDRHPTMQRVAVIWNPADPPRRTEIREVQSAAQQLNLDVLSLPVGTVAQLQSAIGQAKAWPADALVVLEDPLTHSHIQGFVPLIVQAGLPSAHSTAPYARAGGLMSYGADLAEVYRRSAVYVDKILKGAKPADLPVEQADEFELVVNRDTARALGLTIPQSVLAEVTELIP